MQTERQTDEVPVVRDEGTILLDDFTARMVLVIARYRQWYGLEIEVGNVGEFPLQRKPAEWFDHFIEHFTIEDMEPVPEMVVTQINK